MLHYKTSFSDTANVFYIDRANVSYTNGTMDGMLYKPTKWSYIK